VARERPLDGVEQVLGHVIRLVGPALPLVLPLAAAVAREHEHAGGADGVSDGDVGDLVADHDRGAEVQVEVGRRAVEEPGARLPALAVGAVRQGALARMVGADVEAVQPRAPGGELALELRVDGVQHLLVEVALGDPGLVGGHHRGDGGLVEPANGGGGAREEADPAHVVDVADLLGEAAVAVDEHGGASGHRSAV